MSEAKDRYVFKSLVEDVRFETSKVGNFDFNSPENYFLSGLADAKGSEDASASSLKKGTTFASKQDWSTKTDLLFLGSDTQKFVAASFLELKQLQAQTQDLLDYPKAIPNELNLISTKLKEVQSLTEERLATLGV